MTRMIFLLALLLMLPVQAEETVFYAAQHRSWYHGEAGCDFGGFAFADGWSMTESLPVTQADACAAHLRPCPACARERKAVFTGEFPAWAHEFNPWELGHGMEAWLPADVLSGWGDFSGAMYELFGDGPFPDGYAGSFRNACGGSTVMLVDPSAERIGDLRQRTGAEFWVLEADFDWNYLSALQEFLIGMMDGEFGIHSVGMSVDGNCLCVGVDDDDPAMVEAICAAVEEFGFDRRAVVIRREERAQWM